MTRKSLKENLVWSMEDDTFISGQGGGMICASKSFIECYSSLYHLSWLKLDYWEKTILYFIYYKNVWLLMELQALTTEKNIDFL
jgi:hypothetical protein